MLDFHLFPRYLYIDTVSTPQPHSEPHLFLAPILLLSHLPVSRSCPTHPQLPPSQSVTTAYQFFLSKVFLRVNCRVSFPSYLHDTSMGERLLSLFYREGTFPKSQSWEVLNLGLNSDVCASKPSGACTPCSAPGHSSIFSSCPSPLHSFEMLCP